MSNHSFGEVADHGAHILFGVEQGETRNEGRRVVDCAGRSGIITPGAAHCSYGATVTWGDGTRRYVDTLCLWWADDPEAPSVAG